MAGVACADAVVRTDAAGGADRMVGADAIACADAMARVDAVASADAEVGADERPSDAPPYDAAGGATPASARRPNPLISPLPTRHDPSTPPPLNYWDNVAEPLGGAPCPQVALADVRSHI